MSALDNLSIASNVLQVIGFADTVIRAGKNLYDLFNKARFATRNIALLLLELKALLSVVAYVRVFITEHASSPFAQEDGHTLPNVHSTLTLIEQEFQNLRGLLVQTVGSGREGWLSLLQSNVRWALKDHEIAASRHRLNQYTQSLTAALSVSGRRHDIVLRTKLQSIEDKLRAISQSNPPRSLDPKVDTRPPNIRQTFRVSRRQARAACTPIQPQSSPQSSLVKADYTPTRHSRRKDSVITSNTADFNELRLSFISNICPKIYVYEQADQTLLLDTGNNYSLDQITKPAILLQDWLVASFGAMRTGHVVSISEAQAEHLQMLFNFLVASAHAASAETIMEKYNKSSGAKLLNRGFPALECNDAIVQKRGIGSSSIAKRSLPTYLEEKSMTLDTNVGSVKAKILSARSCTDSTTLAFTFKYFGDARLNLSPFAVHFMSHVLETLPPQGERQHLLDPYGFRFHPEFINTWKAFLAKLDINFMHRVLRVVKKQLVLEDDANGIVIDMAPLFEECFFPGQQVNMFICFDEKPGSGNSCPLCHHFFSGIFLWQVMYCSHCGTHYQRIREVINQELSQPSSGSQGRSNNERPPNMMIATMPSELSRRTQYHSIGEFDSNTIKLFMFAVRQLSESLIAMKGTGNSVVRNEAEARWTFLGSIENDLG